MKDCSSPTLFNVDWTISSSVLDGTRCRLTVVSLVSEPSLYFHRAWLLISIDFSLAFQQFKCFLTIHPCIVGPTVEPSSYLKTIRELYIFSILRVFFSGTDYLVNQMSHQVILCKITKTSHILCSLVMCNQRPYAANLTTVVCAKMLFAPVNLDVPFRYDYLDVLLPLLSNQCHVSPSYLNILVLYPL